VNLFIVDDDHEFLTIAQMIGQIAVSNIVIRHNIGSETLQSIYALGNYEQLLELLVELSNRNQFDPASAIFMLDRRIDNRTIQGSEAIEILRQDYGIIPERNCINISNGESNLAKGTMTDLGLWLGKIISVEELVQIFEQMILPSERKIPLK
jgi:hypothetical protein